MARNGKTRWPAIIAGAMLLSGCAAPGVQQERGLERPHAHAGTSSRGETPLWRLDELAQTEQPMVLLRSSHGVHAVLETRLLKRIQAVGEKVLQADGTGRQPNLVVVALPGINAFAFHDGSVPTIAVSLGMINLLAADEDAWAALFGHELAHLRLNHLGDMQSRRERAELSSSVAGLVLSAIGLPFANVATDAASALADRAYSRNDEREADRFGLDYMRRAGFSGRGAIALQQRLLTAQGSGSMPFLSTHPSGEERIENLRKLMSAD